jgi:Helix-hairpin-helix motif
MSSMSCPISIQEGRDPASRREVIRWNWPAGVRGLLAGAVIAAALGLGFAGRSVPESDAEIVKARDLLLDLNTVPPRVLETLPHVGQTLVRQVVAARERRPLTSLEDAGRQVRGLGPVTLAQIAPYLRFDASLERGAKDSEGVLEDLPVVKPRASRRKSTRTRKPKSAPLQPRLVSSSAEAGAL